MLRIYCLQQWYNLSDRGAEEALYDIQSMRAFCDLELGRDPIPDETTILNFRHLLEAHELTKTVFEAVAEYLEARGALLPWRLPRSRIQGGITPAVREPAELSRPTVMLMSLVGKAHKMALPGGEPHYWEIGQ